MPYFTITDFSAGLDLRRSSLAAPAGTLRKMINCHVTPGGEIEKRLAFVHFDDAIPGSRGLVTVSDSMYAFLPITPNTPSHVPDYWRWGVGDWPVDASTLYEVLDWDVYEANQVFAIIVLDTAGNVGRYHGSGNGTSGGSNKITDPNCGGFFCRTYQSKMYTVGGSFLFFSCVGKPREWTNSPDNADGTPGPNQGAGSIDLSAVDSDMAFSQAIEVYFDKVAIFSKTSTQFWKIDADPLQNQFQQTLRGASTLAPKSVLQYGSGDVLYLSVDGIRSLRARNSSLAASVSDIGSPLDPVIQELYRTMGQDWLRRAMAILQPVTGRFWMIFPDRIYVLSAFPGPKITAWSEYWPVDQAGNPITITDVTTYRNTIIVRDVNHRIYAYGGAGQQRPGLPDPITPGQIYDGPTIPQNVYDSSPVELIFPFHGGPDTPATEKTFTGIDATCTGTWDVYVALNPENPDAEDYIGKLIGPSFRQGRLPMVGTGTHISLRLRSTTPGPLTLSNIIVHYNVGEAS